MADSAVNSNETGAQARIALADEAATDRLGQALAAALQPGLRIYLRGPLGAGKTALVRAVLGALGYRGRVKSPTYTLVELYPVSRLNLYHFDFYRFRDSDEWRDAGLSEYFGDDGVCLVEWPEKAGAGLPPADLDIAFSISPSASSPGAFDERPGSETAAVPAPGRDLVLTARSPAGRKCLSGLIPSN
jgi:tRNA threonylcarbamoyladenosine biosynthesis protein TsaE